MFYDCTNASAALSYILLTSQHLHHYIILYFIQPMSALPPKKKKVSITTLKNKLWEHCKRLVRKNYANEDGSWNCYTCGVRITEPAKAQTGHFIPSSTCGAFLRYDLRNLRIQCYKCNINGGGQGAEYYRHMVREVGQEATDQLFRDKEKTVKATDHVIMLLGQYEKM